MEARVPVWNTFFNKSQLALSCEIYTLIVYISLAPSDPPMDIPDAYKLLCPKFKTVTLKHYNIYLSKFMNVFE